MRPFAIALIVLAQMPTLTVQDPDRERREERRVQKLLTELESGDPPRIARGAFDAGENGLKKTIPGLRKALRELAKMDDNTLTQIGFAFFALVTTSVLIYATTTLTKRRKAQRRVMASAKAKIRSQKIKIRLQLEENFDIKCQLEDAQKVST